MPGFFRERDSQSRAKHLILRRYLGAWAGIIGNGVLGVQQRSRGRSFPLDLVYIDGFAGAGRYERDADRAPDPALRVWGSPIIGMQALEDQAAKLRARGLHVRVTGVVCEKERDLYTALLRNLNEARLATPVESPRSLQGGALGRIHAINADFRDVVREMLDWLGPEPFAFAFVDPYGAAMDLASLGRVLGRKRTDGITLFPLHYAMVRGGSVLKPEHLREPSDRGNITAINALFGAEKWQELYRRYEGDPCEREAALQCLYNECIESLDPELWVKLIRLRFSKMPRSAYYLYLTTRNADGAMKMNKVLREAELEEEWEVWRDEKERIRRREEQAPQENMFAMLGMETVHVPEPRREPYKPTPEMVAAELLERCPRGREYALKDVYGFMADTTFLDSEIHQGLKVLRDRGEARFDTLTRNSPVRVGS